MGARFAHRGHDVIHVKLGRFLVAIDAGAQLLAAGPRGFQLLDYPVHIETARQRASRKTEKRVNIFFISSFLLFRFMVMLGKKTWQVIH